MRQRSTNSHKWHCSHKTVADSTSSIVTTVEQAIADDKLTPDEKAQINQLKLQAAQANITTQQTAIKNLVDLMKQVETNAGNHDLTILQFLDWKL